jgi:hypothetical protein
MGSADRDAQQHPDIPDTWREHLRERAEYIDQRMTQRGIELTIERPSWTGPARPRTRHQQAPQAVARLAAEIDRFRAKHAVPADDATAIPNVCATARSARP